MVDSNALTKKDPLITRVNSQVNVQMNKSMADVDLPINKR